MRTVLIVSPHFPPSNMPDMQRVRLSLPHYEAFGWRPVVLAVRPDEVESSQDLLLAAAVPAHVPVHRVNALPVRLTRRVRMGNVGVRAGSFLYAGGRSLIRRERVDLVFFSTTVFPTMALGRAWKAELGVPYVLDMQDPWVYDRGQRVQTVTRPGPKRWLAQSLHHTLEPLAMGGADGLIAVSEDYLVTLRRRYPRLASVPQRTITFGASSADFESLSRSSVPNRFFATDDGLLHGVYAGRASRDMERALRILFGGLRAGLAADPALFSRVRLHFVGTDYATGDRARKTVEPIAEACGVQHLVDEHPHRVSYFETLRLLSDATFLLVPGADDPQYTASKIYPYILAQRPLLAAFHERSSVCRVLRDTGAGALVPFDLDTPPEEYADQCLTLWRQTLATPARPPVRWDAFEPYTARETTRQQCTVFDDVLARRAR